MDNSQVMYLDENIVLLATLGGNNKTSPNVIGLSVVPFPIYSALLEELLKDPTKNTRYLTQTYMSMLPEHISKACGNCMLSKPKSKALKKLKLLGCYAQWNFQTLTQAVANIRRAIFYEAIQKENKGKLRKREWKLMLERASRLDIDHIRSCVVGDLGMVPVKISTDIIATSVFMGFKWLGYTHLWATSEHLKETHQASTQGPWKAAEAARKRGWGVFHMLPRSSGYLHPDYKPCPVLEHKVGGLKTTCTGCPIPCDGKARNLTYNIDHGPGSFGRLGKAGELLQLERRER